MRKIEITAFSLKEAKEKALAQGITVVRNVTISYNNENPGNFDAFAEEMLEKNKLENTSGVGCIVVLEAGSADTRERPYEFKNNSVEGKITKKRVYEVMRKSDNSVVAQKESKAAAIRAAKSLMKSLKTDLICKQVYRVVGDKELAFELKYVPSINTKEGKYIVFGNY